MQCRGAFFWTNGPSICDLSRITLFQRTLAVRIIHADVCDYVQLPARIASLRIIDVLDLSLLSISTLQLRTQKSLFAVIRMITNVD